MPPGNACGRCQQFAPSAEGDWYRVGENLLTQLKAAKIDARKGRFDTPSHAGVQVFDAESDYDLDRVVEIGRRLAGPVLGAEAVDWPVSWHAAVMPA